MVCACASLRVSSPTAAQVALFVDTYEHLLPIRMWRIAAVEVLEAAGFRVVMPGVTDAGRPALSKGLVDLARRKAAKAVWLRWRPCRGGAAHRFSGAERLVCGRGRLLCALLPDDARVPVVPRRAVTFEQFIADLADRGELASPSSRTAARCCSTATVTRRRSAGTAPRCACWRLPPGCQVQRGGQQLLRHGRRLRLRGGALRGLAPDGGDCALCRRCGRRPADTLIVAAGVSCRQQIAHGAGRPALHPAEALRMALQPSS